MSCFLSTTYWVFLFHVLHVKYEIKRPNSLSFFFIILASEFIYELHVFVIICARNIGRPTDLYIQRSVYREVESSI